MVSALIKHELRRTWRWLLLTAALATVAVAISYLAAVLLPAPLNGFFAGLGIVVAVAMPFAVQLLLGLEFYRSSYSRTGYFTHSLPVRGRTVFLAKFGYSSVVAIVFLLLGLALAFVAFTGSLVAQGATAGEVWRGARQGLEQILAATPAWVAVVLIGMALLFPVAGLAHHFFAASVGSEGWINRMGFGGVVLVWVLYYLANQVVAAVGLFLPLNAVVDSGSLTMSTDPLIVLQGDTLDALIPFGAFAMILALAAVAIWRAAVSVDRKVELR